MKTTQKPSKGEALSSAQLRILTPLATLFIRGSRRALERARREKVSLFAGAPAGLEALFEKLASMEIPPPFAARSRATKPRRKSGQRSSRAL